MKPCLAYPALFLYKFGADLNNLAGTLLETLGPFIEWTGKDVCRAQDARIEKIKAEKLGIGRRRTVTRCTCECGGGICMQSRLDLMAPTLLGPR